MLHLSNLYLKYTSRKIFFVQKYTSTRRIKKPFVHTIVFALTCFLFLINTLSLWAITLEFCSLQSIKTSWMSNIYFRMNLIFWISVSSFEYKEIHDDYFKNTKRIVKFSFLFFFKNTQNMGHTKYFIVMLFDVSMTFSKALTVLEIGQCQIWQTHFTIWENKTQISDHIFLSVHKIRTKTCLIL